MLGGGLSVLGSRWFLLGGGISLIGLGVIHPMDGILAVMDFASLFVGSFVVGYAVYGKWEDV